MRFFAQRQGLRSVSGKYDEAKAGDTAGKHQEEAGAGRNCNCCNKSSLYGIAFACFCW